MSVLSMEEMYQHQRERAEKAEARIKELERVLRILVNELDPPTREDVSDARAVLEKGEQPSAAKLPTENRCPSCNSPDPKRHPSTQYEGEVWLCSDPYHWEIKP